MRRLLISYDLQTPNRTAVDYKNLFAELDLLTAKQVQKCVWVVRTDADAFDVFEQLQRHLFPFDRLLVIRCDGFRSRGEINKISKI